MFRFAPVAHAEEVQRRAEHERYPMPASIDAPVEVSLSLPLEVDFRGRDGPDLVVLACKDGDQGLSHAREVSS